MIPETVISGSMMKWINDNFHVFRQIQISNSAMLMISVYMLAWLTLSVISRSNGTEVPHSNACEA